MRWDWLFLAASGCALAGWLLGLYLSHVPYVQRSAKFLLIGGLSAGAGLIALNVAIFALLVYLPAARMFDDGWPLTAAVWIQATSMTVAAVMAVRHNLVNWLPMLVFVVTTLGFGAWLALNPLEWLPHQD